MCDVFGIDVGDCVGCCGSEMLDEACENEEEKRDFRGFASSRCQGDFLMVFRTDRAGNDRPAIGRRLGDVQPTGWTRCQRITIRIKNLPRCPRVVGIRHAMIEGGYEDTGTTRVHDGWHKNARKSQSVQGKSAFTWLGS